MLQKSRQIVLDTSQKFRIISHTEHAVPIDKVLFEGPRLNFVLRGFISPANSTAWFTGSALSDDSQFFATALNLPEPTGSLPRQS
jgi:hypothetical protein